LGDDEGLVQLADCGAKREGRDDLHRLAACRRCEPAAAYKLAGRGRLKDRRRLCQSRGKSATGAARPEGAKGRLGGRCRGPVPGCGQGMAQSADDQSAHRASVAKAHLGLGRMDIDIDRVRRRRQI